MQRLVWMSQWRLYLIKAHGMLKVRLDVTSVLRQTVALPVAVSIAV